jgi:uncharacterized protein
MKLELLDWKRQIAELYARVRAAPDAAAAWREWREVRDKLFASHPESPLEPSARACFRGLDYFDYDPGVRVLATVEPSEPAAIEIPVSRGETHRFTRFGHARFELHGEPQSLEIYWLEGYGGGAYLPVADATSGATTYGAGRYLLDTVKGADLGAEGEQLVLDFNFAYNPSCAYDPRWACPLAPLENRLPIEVRAGERNVWRTDGSHA